MDWSQVLYAGLGGGAGAALGVVVALGINKGIKNTKYHNGIRAAFAGGLAVLGMNFTKSMYADMQLPRVGTSMEQSLLKSAPIYPEMKQYEPEYFEKIVRTLDKGFREGKSEDELINEGRDLLIKLIIEKAKYSDGETLTTMMEITRQNYLDFKVNKPYLCVLMLNQKGMGDIGPYVSEISKKLENGYMLKVISMPRNQVKSVDPQMAKKSFEKAIIEMQKLLPTGYSLDPPTNASEETLKKVCDIGVSTMDVILALPEPERSNYIRSTLGQ